MAPALEIVSIAVHVAARRNALAGERGLEDAIPPKSRDARQI